MSESDVAVVEIYRARSLPEAHAIRLMMQREGIDVWISNETLQGIVGEIAMGWSTSPRLMVKLQDADRARLLVEQFSDQAARQIMSSAEVGLACLACGTAMGSDAHCPKCGWNYGDGPGDVAAVVDQQSESAVPDRIGDEGDRLNGDFPTEGILPVLSDRPVLPVREVWWEVTAVLCIGCFPHLFGCILYHSRSPGVDSYWVNLGDLLINSICSTFAVLYLMHRSGERWREFGFSSPRTTDLALGLILMLVLWYFGAIVNLAVSGGYTAEEISTSPESSFDFALMFVTFALSAFSEEVIMRAYLLTRLRQLIHRPWLGMAISALLFALYHTYQGFEGFANALLFGFVLGSVFCLYPRIWPLVICHASSNILLELRAIP